MLRSQAMRAGLSCFAMVLLASLVPAASAQIKVAVVNSQQALLDSDELKKASAELEKKYKPKQDELQKLQNELQGIEQQISSGKLNERAIAELQVQGQRKQRDAQRISDDTQQEFDRDRQEVVGKSAQKMQDVIKKLSEERGLDLVLDAAQALSFKTALDITKDVVAAYNKTYPAK